MNLFQKLNKLQSGLLISCMILCQIVLANTGSIEGRVTDDESNEGLPFANVAIKILGKTEGAQTDFDGFYSIKGIPVGTYKLEASYLGYQTQIIKKVKVVLGQTTKVNIKMDQENEVLAEVVVVDYKVPLIRADQTSTGRTVTRNDLRSRSSGTYQRSNRKKRKAKRAGDINVKGSRAESTNYYIDGIKVRGSSKFTCEYTKEHNREGYDEIVENAFYNTTDQALSTFSIDVDAASYANLRRMINNGEKPLGSAVRIEEMINYFDYEYPQPTTDVPFNLVTELSACPWNEQHQLFHIGLQGKSVDTSNLPPSNLVFLIDVSGSMAYPSKLPLLIQSFKLLVDQLRTNDRVAIVVYAGSSGLVLPSTSGSAKATITAALENLRAGGSTAGAEGIQLAYKVAKEHFIEGGNNRVILATDGDFNVGISSDGELVKLIEAKREEGVFLSVLGFGMGNYQDAKMQKLANKGNGNHFYIDGLSEAKKVLVSEFGGTLFTIAKDVKLQLEFNPAKVAGYRLIGYENRLLANQDFKDDKKDAGELGAGHTVTALYEIIPVSVKSDYLVDEENLKYQKPVELSPSEELLTVKLRYKKPDENKSRLIEIPVSDNHIDIQNATSSFKLAAGVAQFGLLLRNSKYKENANFDSVIKLAKQGMGKDLYGYQAEFISLVKKVKFM